MSGGIKNVLELSIRATNGTFGELVNVCLHLNTLRNFVGPTNELASTGQPLGDVQFATDGSHLSLDDLLSRLLPTAFEYPIATSMQAKIFRGVRIASHAPGIHLAFPMRGIPDELKRLTDGKNVYIGSSNQVLPVFGKSDDAGDTLIVARRDGEVHLNILPVSHYGGKGDFMVVIQDFPNGDKLTEFIKLYLVSYILGMLARYYPSIWTALLRNEKGDFAQLLLVDAVEAIERNFAEHLSYQLTGTVKKWS